MRTLVALAVLVATLVAPSGAFAQGGSPFEPLPPAPPEAPEQPVPTESVPDDDDSFGALEWLALGGIAIALLGGAAWAIAREGGGGLRRRRRSRVGAKGRNAGRSAAAGASARDSRSRADGKDGVKAPPPPPRKRQAAAAKRRAKGSKGRAKARRR